MFLKYMPIWKIAKRAMSDEKANQGLYPSTDICQ